jgi:hypothetical protein
MKVQLNINHFENNKFTVAFDEDKEALFTIVDTSFEGNGDIGNISVITVLVREITLDGSPSGASLRIPIIGMGDGVVGVTTRNPALRGLRLNVNNMAECLVLLGEEV